jgi:hypothetical protein
LLKGDGSSRLVIYHDIFNGRKENLTMEKSKGEKTLKQKILAGMFAGMVTVTAMSGLAGCDDGKDKQVNPPAGTEQPADPGTGTEQSGDADDGADLAPPDAGEVTGGRGGTLVPEEYPELNGHTQAEYDRMKELADRAAQELLDTHGWAEKITAIEIFPEKAPNDYIVHYVDDAGQEWNVDWNP